MMAEAQLTEAQSSLVRVRAGYAPPTRLKVSEFADAHIIVTSGPLAGTKWQTSFAPYQRGIMDAFHEPGVTHVIVKGSSQWGKTAIAVNLVAFHIAHDPCPIMVVSPTVDPMAKDFAVNRLEPVISATPILRDAVSKKRAKDATNTTLAKTFRGGAISISGANSAASLASRAIRVLVLDEVDRYPAELPGEGSTLAIALKRTTTFRGRKRVLMASSPTFEGAPIDAWHQRGDQRRYYVPCPACGHMHAFEWQNVKWVDDDPATARLHCPSCDHPITDAERVAILSGGTWRPEKPGRRDKAIVSFHLWEAYSPLSSLSEIVGTFLSAREKQKAGDKAEMHTWQNTTLGEAVEAEQGIKVDPDSLLLRREMYPDAIDVPAGACCLTMGVDTQDDRLELLVIGWGPGEESWIVDRQTLSGDTSRPEPWAALDQALDQPYRHASGQDLYIQATCIDSAGHRTTMVYDYAEKKAARKVFAIIGRDGQRPIVSSPSPKRWGRDERQVPLYTIGVDAAKALWVSRFKMTERGPGFMHLPSADWCDAEFAAQLTSEKLVTKFHRGQRMQVWRKIRTRNEALDCSVYGLGALRLLNPRLPQMAARLASLMPIVPSAPEGLDGTTAPPTPTRPPAAPRARRVSRSNYLK